LSPSDVYVTGRAPTPQGWLEGLGTVQKKVDGDSPRRGRWSDKQATAAAAVPLLGPDLVDPRQMDELRDACRNPEKYQREIKELPKRMAAGTLEEVKESPTPAQTLAAKINDALKLQHPVGAQKDSLVVDPANSLEVFAHLKEAHGYDYLANLTSTDYEDCFEVVSHLAPINGGPVLCVKVRTAKDAPIVPSLTAIWPGANFQEREVYDMMGIRLEGHPSLKRILLWEGFQGYPLRKDYLEPYYEEPGKIFSSRWRDGFHQRAEERAPFHRNVIYPK